ncbi:hypothetical protein Bca4012_006304 [Brassica carinata]|uniref:(rape) hypothetical protein n=1 Tax=Brassica napus TaxID=3708 RepID=A0A816ILU7_BRANA|nr:unnamed protein product [Brassica napus]
MDGVTDDRLLDREVNRTPHDDDCVADTCGVFERLGDASDKGKGKETRPDIHGIQFS